MKPRLTAVLLHGMGNAPAWWTPFISGLEEIGIAARAPLLPDLATASPDDWIQAALAALPDSPAVLIGHSLGAAVALHVARQKPVHGVFLLAMPVGADGDLPPLPRGSRLPLAALIRVGRFLSQTALEIANSTVAATHIVGDRDSKVDIAQARRLPFPVVGLPGAGHELNRRDADVRAIIAVVASSPAAKRWLDPAARRSASLDARQNPDVAVLAGGTEAPPPARLDVEITSRCQLRCAHCARTLCRDRREPADMPLPTFERLLDEAEHADELIFVGLGEPLLHPDAERFVAAAAARGLRLKLVTNGLAADPDALARLRDRGLREVTFSIDSVDRRRFADLRGGAPLDRVLSNFRATPEGLKKSIFAALSRTNVSDLGALAALARENGLPAIAVSDLNFDENSGAALRGADLDAVLDKELAKARAAGVLVLGPHLHEVRDPAKEYRHCLVRSAADLTARPERHAHCLAPWRIAVVGAQGEITPCNCAPFRPVGSLARHSLGEIWNGQAMAEWRRRVAGNQESLCRNCPRW